MFGVVMVLAMMRMIGMIGMMWLRFAGLGLGLGSWLGLGFGHIDDVAIVSSSLHYQGTEGGGGLDIGLLFLFLTIDINFSLLLIILGGNHTQWVTGVLVLVLAVLLVEVKERWNRGNASANARLGGQMLDAIEGTAQQTCHRDLILAVGQLEQLIVLLPGYLMNAQDLRPSGS